VHLVELNGSVNLRMHLVQRQRNMKHPSIAEFKVLC